MSSFYWSIIFCFINIYRVYIYAVFVYVYSFTDTFSKFGFIFSCCFKHLCVARLIINSEHIRNKKLNTKKNISLIFGFFIYSYFLPVRFLYFSLMAWVMFDDKKIFYFEILLLLMWCKQTKKQKLFSFLLHEILPFKICM